MYITHGGKIVNMPNIHIRDRYSDCKYSAMTADLFFRPVTLQVLIYYSLDNFPAHNMAQSVLNKCS